MVIADWLTDRNAACLFMGLSICLSIDPSCPRFILGFL